MGDVIPLHIEERGVSLECHVFSYLIPKPKLTRFYVDTGSPLTILSQVDGDVMGVDIDRLPRNMKSHLGYGGKMELRMIRNVAVVLVTKHGKPITISLPEIGLNATKSQKKRDECRLNALPSVLGRDILQAGKFKFILDLANKEGYFELC